MQTRSDTQIICDRSALHRIPELDKDLPETLAYLKQALAGLNCEIFEPMSNALCAWFDFGADHTIAFRSDMDALPVAERTGADFASCHPGRMHACGHDGHMAILLETARRLSAAKHMPNNILLVFQPAEETTGGARDLCETGVFQKYGTEAIFGLHLWPGLAPGTVWSRRQELMARSCEVNIDIFGRSAHIAKASEGLDALAAAAEFYRRSCDMEAALPAGVYRLLKFGRMEAGTVRNALAEHARLEGSLRAFQDDIYLSMRSGLLRIAEELQGSTGCRIEVNMNDGYPAVMNPDGLYDRVRSAVAFGELPEPSMTAEDFSWYQKYLPGMFFFLGIGSTPPLHADNFNFDETALLKGADLYMNIAEALK